MHSMPPSRRSSPCSLLPLNIVLIVIALISIVSAQSARVPLDAVLQQHADRDHNIIIR